MTCGRIMLLVHVFLVILVAFEVNGHRHQQKGICSHGQTSKNIFWSIIVLGVASLNHSCQPTLLSWILLT